MIITKMCWTKCHKQNGIFPKAIVCRLCKKQKDWFVFKFNDVFFLYAIVISNCCRTIVASWNHFNCCTMDSTINFMYMRLSLPCQYINLTLLTYSTYDFVLKFRFSFFWKFLDFNQRSNQKKSTPQIDLNNCHT